MKNDMLVATKNVLHQALLHIRDNGPIYTDCGICTNVGTVLRKLKDDAVDTPLVDDPYRDAHLRLKKLVKFYGSIMSKDVEYPVEGSWQEYDCNCQKWDTNTEHGQNRWAMLNTLIDLNGGGK